MISSASPLALHALTALALAMALAGCGGGGTSADSSSIAPTSAASADDESVFLTTANDRATAAAVSTRLQLVRADLHAPWALAVLPDGRALVTEKAGTLKILPAGGAGTAAVVRGLPAVANEGQGGLLDVAVPPDYPARDDHVYFTYAEPQPEQYGGSYRLAVARARLSGTSLVDLQVLRRTWPRSASTSQYGSRLAFGRDGKLYIGAGDRRLDDPAAPGYSNAQSPWTENGKILRVNRDGSDPSDNPLINGGQALRTIYSFGHRNPQGLAVHPYTGQLWEVEHGPQGGDELNVIEPGRNYGWPIVSYGCVYGAPIGSACRVGGGTHAPRFREPVAVWVPTSTAPSSLMFYNGSRFPEWNGSALITALGGQTIWRVALNGTTEARRERIVPETGERFRHIAQGRDGWLYTITDSGKLYRIVR